MSDLKRNLERFKAATEEAKAAVPHKEIVEKNSFAIVEKRTEGIEAVTTPVGDAIIQVIEAILALAVYFPLKACKAVFDFFKSYSGEINLKHYDHATKTWTNIPSNNPENAMNWYKYYLSRILLRIAFRKNDNINPTIVEQFEDEHEASVVFNQVALIAGLIIIFGGLFLCLVLPGLK